MRVKTLLLGILIVAQSVLAKDIYRKNVALFCLNKDMPQLEIKNTNGHPETQFPWLNHLIAKYDISEINRWITSADENDVDGDVKLMNIYRVVFSTDRDMAELEGVLEDFRAVADVYDALVSERPYKHAWSTTDAQDYLHKHAGSQFDPICVEAFFERLDNINNIHQVFSDG